MSGGGAVAFRHYLRQGLTVVVLTNCQGAGPERLAAEIAGLFLDRR
jgi:hypothetical protein